MRVKFASSRCTRGAVAGSFRPGDYGYRRSHDPNLLTIGATEHTALEKALPGNAETATRAGQRFLKLDPQGVCNTLRASTDSARGAFTSPRPIHPKRSRRHYRTRSRACLPIRTGSVSTRPSGTAFAKSAIACRRCWRARQLPASVLNALDLAPANRKNAGIRRRFSVAHDHGRCREVFSVSRTDDCATRAPGRNQTGEHTAPFANRRPAMSSKRPAGNRYAAIIERIFHAGYRKGREVPFCSRRPGGCRKARASELPKNLAICFIRFAIAIRSPIRSWKQRHPGTVDNRVDRRREVRFSQTKIQPDRAQGRSRSPQIPTRPRNRRRLYKGDEQALFARCDNRFDRHFPRCRRLLAAKPPANRSGISQIEIDELYVAIDKFGAPCHSRTGEGRQDQLPSWCNRGKTSYCTEKIPGLNAGPCRLSSWRTASPCSNWHWRRRTGRVAGKARTTRSSRFWTEAADIAAYRDRAKRG